MNTVFVGLWLLAPVQADILPPAPTGFVAEVPDPPRLPPHPVPVGPAVGLVLVVLVGLGAGLLLRRQAGKNPDSAFQDGPSDDIP